MVMHSAARSPTYSDRIHPMQVKSSQSAWLLLFPPDLIMGQDVSFPLVPYLSIGSPQSSGHFLKTPEAKSLTANRASMRTEFQKL